MNGGSLIFYRKGLYTFLPLNVHVNENYLATILSLKYVNKIPGLRVTMDTLVDKAMNVILGDGAALKFKDCGSGLYSYYMESIDVDDSAKTNATITP